MVGFQMWQLVAQVLVIIVGYAVAGQAIYVYSRSNSRSLSFLGTGIALQSTPFLLSFIANRWMEIPNILFINYILQFSGFAFIGYAIVLHSNE